MSPYDPLDLEVRRSRRKDPDQLGLFDQPAPHQRHSNTSKAAAIQIEPHAKGLRARVLRHLQACGSAGATDEEIQVALSMSPSTERPRRIELERAGLVRRTELRRPTLSGRKAAVFVAAEGAA